ncbi:hypothetical protein BJX96DRAFT_141467 [Aspergillus floccosus]
MLLLLSAAGSSFVSWQSRVAVGPSPYILVHFAVLRSQKEHGAEMTLRLQRLCDVSRGVRSV